MTLIARLNREVGILGLQTIVQTLEDTINTKSKETEAIQEAGLTTLWRLAANTGTLSLMVSLICHNCSCHRS
jgi:hypothetical protein